MSDLRYALRVLLKSPGFTLVVVLVLGLGIGATTAIFSVVDQALLRPLPFPDAERLYFLMETDKGRRNMPSSPESYSFLVEQNRAFEALGGMWGRSVTLTGIPEPQQLEAQTFSPNIFQVLGIPPILGRTFLPEEDRPGAEPVAVLGEKPWRELFSSDPDIVGKLITLDGRGYRVVGVMPASFHGPRLAENYVLWLPLSQRGENARVPPYINLYGRLRPGVSETEARAQMEVIAGRLGHSIHVTPLREQFVGDRRPELLLMLGAVALVLLIGCANIANLLLARAAGRAREMVVRAAIGASRFRLIRQSLAESFLLAIAGGVAGLLLAVWVLHPLLAANLNLSLLLSVVLDLRLMAFAVAASLLTTVLCGLLPALEASRVDLHRGLKEGSGQASPSRRSNRARSALIVAEVALSLTLLAGAATMIQSFLRIRPANPGFEVENRLVLTFWLSQNRYGQASQQADFVRRLKERLASVPGVRGVAVSTTLPLTGMVSLLTVLPEEKSGKPIDVFYEAVSEEYFSLMGIPLRQGRAFNRSDRDGAPAVAIVNEAFAQQFFGASSPVGRTITFQVRQANRVCTIVGIAANTKMMVELFKPRPLVFLPLEQAPPSRFEMILATAMPPMSLLPAARRALRDVDPNQAIAQTHTMQQVVNTMMPQVNFRTVLMSAMAAVALLLAAIGIYAVIAQGVIQRTREIGIRVALGAGRGDVLRLVAWQGLLQLAIGIALGSLGAWAGVRLLVKAFYKVFPIGLGVFAIVVAALAVVAIAASLLPARRALKVDPIQALRYE